MAGPAPSRRASPGLCPALRKATGPGAPSGPSTLLLCVRAAAGLGQGHGRLLHCPARPSPWGEATSEATHSVKRPGLPMPLGWAAPAPLWVGGL